jgi:hypothetical protein
MKTLGHLRAKLLSRHVVKNKNLLFLSRFSFSGGPDEIRTRDLGLDRAACLAATPRVRAGCILLHKPGVVKEKPANFWRFI